MIRSFAVKVCDEIVVTRGKEKESIDENNDDDGVASIETRNPRGVTKPSGVASGAQTRSEGTTQSG